MKAAGTLPGWLKLRRAGWKFRFSAEVAAVQPKLPIFGSATASSADCITIRRTHRIFSRRRAFPTRSVKLQPKSRNFSRTGITPDEVRRFQPDLRFSGVLHREQAATPNFRTKRYHSNALAGFSAGLAHLQPKYDFVHPHKLRDVNPKQVNSGAAI